MDEHEQPNDEPNMDNAYVMLDEDRLDQSKSFEQEEDFDDIDEPEEIETGEEGAAAIPNHLLPPNKRVILDQERYLPIANVSRIIKRLLPSSGKVAKEAKECVQECVSEFISFLTSEACDRCRNDKRKTISADDLMKSMINMGFDEYIEPMEIFMRRYREINRLPQRPSYRPQAYANTPVGAMLTQPIAITLPNNAQFGQIAAGGNHIQIPNIVQGGGNGQAPVYATVAAPSTQSPATFAVVNSEQGGASTTLETMPQIMVDPSTNQHYMMVENQDGTRELRAVQVVTGDAAQYSDKPSTSGLQSNSSASKASTSSAPGPIKNAPRIQRPGPYRANRQ